MFGQGTYNYHKKPGVFVTAAKVLWLLIYNSFLFPLLYLSFIVGSFSNRKIRDGFRERRGWKNTLKATVEKLKYKNSIYLFHATSVGELQQALPIIRLLKSNNPAISVGISFFSPSGYRFFKGDPNVDFVCYLPLDSWTNAKTFFSIVKPKCWIVSKFDVWPNFTFRCHMMNIPAFIISATLSSSSKRLNPLLKGFNKSLYSCFTKIFPISDDDRDRFMSFYHKKDALIVAGDTRFDQVVYRSQGAAEKARTLPFAKDGKKFLMLGSIWENDAEVVMPPTVSILRDYPDLYSIITPHEPHDEFCKNIEAPLREAGLSSVRFSNIKNEGSCESRVIIIDMIGLLAQIYSISTLAYIGGSFSTGVHNVMEPAIMGIPVIFGPRHFNSFEALQMKQRGGAFEITTSIEYDQIVRKLLNSELYMRETGISVKKYVLENVGAAQRIFKELEKTLESTIS
jgi:3-deoxy-D-manno-octulosonic-acid transferase